MTTTRAAGERGGGGFDVDRLLNFEKRSGIKDGEIETFITKVDAVNAAIQAMKDGEIDPADVHVDGVPTIEEEHQMEEEKRKKRDDLARRERENRERKKKEEIETWWRGAEVLYGDRKHLSGIEAAEESRIHGKGRAGAGRNDIRSNLSKVRPLSQEERTRLKERYSMEYSRWESWTPSDPATLSEQKECEEAEDEKRSREFEESNPDFCKQMTDDMKTRSEAREKKDSKATAARLKGNRFYKAKRWEKALELYMDSLRARPYTVKTLANTAQALMKLERWTDAVEFCDRAIHVDGHCVKALSRRASALVKLAGDYATPTAETADNAPRNDSASTSGVNSVGNDEGGCKDAVSTPERGAESGVGTGTDAFHVRYGGREGMVALALVDLDTAVGIDPASGDLRRQRDNLSRQIEEERAEVEVMKNLRHLPVTSSSARVGSKLSCPRTADGLQRKDDVGAALSPVAEEPEEIATGNSVCNAKDTRHDVGRTPWVSAGLPTPTVAPRNEGLGGGTPVTRTKCAGNPVEGEEDLQTVDRLLEEALHDRMVEVGPNEGGGEGDAHDIGMALLSHPLLRLTAILETGSTARVYFRASGGLARLASATAFAAAAVSTHHHDPQETCHFDHGITIPPATASLSTSGIHASTGTSIPSGADHGIANGDSTKVLGRSTGGVGSGVLGQRRFSFMLSAVAAALEGGERLAQQEVMRSGVLGGCAQALRITFGRERREDNTTAESIGAAGAAALVLCRMVDDADVRVHIARSAPLLGGLVDLIAAASAAPLAVEAAAATLRDVLIGCTASAAKTTLRDVTITRGALNADEKGRGSGAASSPTGVIAEAINAWKDINGYMKGAPVSTGVALCGALANLALHEEFRGAFAEECCLMAAGGGSTCGRTPAAVLVLIAGDKKADRSEVRSLALAALTNACLHNDRVQATILGEGGLALTLAVLSLEGKERSRHIPPLVAARSAGLLARLSSHPPSLEAMSRPGAIERIIKATLRSAALGGNLYEATGIDEANILGAPATIVTTVTNGNTSHNSSTTGVIVNNTNSATEREHLVRTLASVLHSAAASQTRRGAAKTGSPAPSSNVQDKHTERTGEEHLAKAAERLELAGALVSFLPPARRDGLQGVTGDSVALRPDWCAPSTVTANVCSCLLHLLGGKETGAIAKQVVEAGGIPRLVSLFANSGGGGTAVTARKNAAICLAKVARNPKHKETISKLRGMEMLLQAGSGLAV